MAEQPSNCSKCGASLADGARFCPDCGKPVARRISGSSGVAGSTVALVGLSMAALLLAGAGYFVATGGDPGADLDRDGVISLEEGQVELEKLIKPRRGSWRATVVASNIEAPSAITDGIHEGIDSFHQEFDSCQSWSEMEELLDEIRNPQNYRDFIDDEEGEFRIEGLSIKGELVDLAVFASARRGDPGEAEFSLTGTISEERVAVDVPFKYTEFNSNGTIDRDDSFSVNYNLVAERVADCG